ncbi:hypothetical protein HY988_00820 [Candidatus Micrarchaeota archaeon]|nr:hypothetical protein [Candidatus Micrarchaeota archaeon]
MTQRKYYRQIIIRYIALPQQEQDENAEIDYIYQCLGLGDERDDVGLLVFRALVKASGQGTGISSKDIMELSEVSQAAVIYHLNMFQRSGLVIRDGRIYRLRGDNLEQTLSEMQNDMDRRFGHLKEVARRIQTK